MAKDRCDEWHISSNSLILLVTDIFVIRVYHRPYHLCFLCEKMTEKEFIKK